MTLTRRTFLSTALAGTALGAIDLSRVHAQEGGTLRIGMTLSDIPLPNGQPDQGAEGLRFIGLTVFDALIQWDL